MLEGMTDTDFAAATDPSTADAWDGPFDADPAEAGDPSGQTVTSHRRSSRKPTGVRRVVTHTLGVAELSERQRTILSHLSGMRSWSGDLAKLAVSSLDAAGEARAVGELLLAIASADPLEAGVLATEVALDRTRCMVAYATLEAIGVLEDAASQSVPVKAGLNVARSAQKMSPKDRKDLGAVVELLV